MVYPRWKSLFMGVVVGLLVLEVPPPLNGEPSHGELSRSGDPLLVEARKVDLNFVGPEKADQRRAEELYSQYVGKHPESPLVSYIYYHLGHLYTTQAA
jgi:hypothetical protein